MDTTETNCPMCGGRAELRSGTTRYRRGARVVAVSTQYWRCDGGCPGADDDGHFDFEDAEVLRANDAAAQRAWLERFGEPMPPPKRPGRRTASPRHRRVPVLMSDAEVELLDQLRGDLSRGEFLRRALKSQAGDGGEVSIG